MEVVNGKVDAFIYDAPYNLVANVQRGEGKLVFLDKPFTDEPIGWAIAQGDPEFLKAINAFLVKIKKDGSARQATPEVVQEYGLAERRAVSRGLQTTVRPVALARAAGRYPAGTGDRAVDRYQAGSLRMALGTGSAVLRLSGGRTPNCAICWDRHQNQSRWRCQPSRRFSRKVVDNR